MILCMVRHLPTSWNLDGRLQGRNDRPLLPLDTDSARVVRENAERLHREGPWDAILTSPLERARMTAHAHGFGEAIDEPLAIELDFGPWEGRRKADLAATEDNQWTEAPHTIVFGEPFSAFVARIEAFLAKYAAASRVLLFGHGAWIRAALAHVEDGDARLMNQRDIANGTLLTLSVAPEGPPTARTAAMRNRP